MFLRYVRNVIRFKKWKLLCLLVALFLGLKYLPTLLTFRARVDQLFELHKCPGCFGVKSCDFARKTDLSLNDPAEILLYFFAAKNVFFGNIGEKRVVLKKLAHYSELEEFDERLQERSNYSHLFTKSSKKQIVNFHELIKKEVSLSFEEDHLSRLRLCPTTGRLNKLLENVYLNNKEADRETLEANIWTLVSINPEPLVLQILSAKEGWPVPSYLGACGRLIIEEYSGEPLYTYYNTPWLLRAEISSSLLHAAHTFTFRSKDFAFYLTDVSADNIAITSNRTAIFVDLENVIVVDKTPPTAPKGWDELYENTEELPGHLIFSAKEICSHRVSDHNFYAVCQMLLSPKASDASLPGGLLHSVPANITQEYPMLQYLLHQCATPTGPYNRIDAGEQLTELIDKILKKAM